MNWNEAYEFVNSSHAKDTSGVLMNFQLVKIPSVS